jgi:hypothetical protein
MTEGALGKRALSQAGLVFVGQHDVTGGTGASGVQSRGSLVRRDVLGFL